MPKRSPRHLEPPRQAWRLTLFAFGLTASILAAWVASVALVPHDPAPPTPSQPGALPTVPAEPAPTAASTTTTRPRQPSTTRDPSTTSPATTPATGAPSTTAPPPTAAPSQPGVPAALANLTAVVGAARQQGSADKEAEDLLHRADELANAVQEGKGEEVQKKLAELERKLEDLIDGGKVRPPATTQLRRAVAELAQAVQQPG
jgi:hypothetical protein